MVIFTKSSNIEDTDIVGRSLEWDALVDPIDDVVKHPTVDGFGQCIASIVGFVYLQRDPGDIQNIHQYKSFRIKMEGDEFFFNHMVGVINSFQSHSEAPSILPRKILKNRPISALKTYFC